jgi:ribosomal protein L14
MGSNPIFVIIKMIQKRTQLKINDNSGIKIGQCIKVYKKNIGNIGDKILISVKKLRLNQKKLIKIKKGDLFRAFKFKVFIKKKIQLII